MDGTNTMDNTSHEPMPPWGIGYRYQHSLNLIIVLSHNARLGTDSMETGTFSIITTMFNSFTAINIT